MHTNVLIPLDGSDGAEAAVDEAVRLAPAVKKAHLMLVESPVVKAYHLEGYTMYADHIVEMRVQSGKDYLRPFQERLEAAGLEVTVSIRFGDPVRSIVKEAEALGTDLILLGGEEGGWLWRHTGLAGIAYRLSRRVDATVLVVQGTAETEELAVAGSDGSLRAA